MLCFVIGQGGTHVESVRVELLRVGEDGGVVVDGHHVQVHRRALLHLVPCVLSQHRFIHKTTCRCSFIQKKRKYPLFDEKAVAWFDKYLRVFGEN